MVAHDRGAGVEVTHISLRVCDVQLSSQGVCPLSAQEAPAQPPIAESQVLQLSIDYHDIGYLNIGTGAASLRFVPPDRLGTFGNGKTAFVLK
eukprot:1137034-Pelagomonas_calceolata.AAC.7